MGFTINKNIVFTDHTTDDYAITEYRNEHSPCFGRYKKQNMDLYSIFYRKGGNNRGQLGDNCPFLYALKKRDNLILDEYALSKLKPNFYEIINHLHTLIIERYKNIDFIIPMPSSHPYSVLLAKILQRKIFQKSVVLDNFLLKKTNQEIYQEISNLDLKPKDINMLLRSIKQADQKGIPFSVSNFPVSFRQKISPLKINDLDPKIGTYLLVDDLTATGSTFFSAKKEILNNNKTSVITAVSLFSPLNNRIR